MPYFADKLNNIARMLVSLCPGNCGEDSWRSQLVSYILSCFMTHIMQTA